MTEEASNPDDGRSFDQRQTNSRLHDWLVQGEL